MPFTPKEMTDITAAALDWYLMPDGLTPLERAEKRLEEARYALEEAQQQLRVAEAYQAQVHLMSSAEQNKRWETKGSPLKESLKGKPTG